MSIRDDIKPYIDSDGLVSNKVTESYRSSDNGVLFTSQYIHILSAERFSLNKLDFISLNNCIDEKGYLHRAPDDITTDAPDDHYGILSVAHMFESPLKRIKLPWTMYFQPVLLYLWLAQRGWHELMAPLAPLVAIILAGSNRNSPTSDTSNRLLTWCSLKAFMKLSRLGKWAWDIWYTNQQLTYATVKPMRVIASIYFGAQHPISVYIE